jgi:gliding motility-associated-like protein
MNGRTLLSLAFGTLLCAGSPLAQCVGPAIATFPHLEDFEAGPVWMAGGTASDWAWGTPAHPTINSAGGGVNSWCVGGLTGSFYNLGQLAYIESPCFDLSALQYPWISFKIFWEVERQYDGMVLQYSLNGGATYTNVGAFGDPVDCLNDNWYNEDNVNNLTSASPRHGWSGRIGPSVGSCSGGSGSGAWVTAMHCLNGLAGEPSVRFRFLFGAGTACNSYDGIGIDDVLLSEAPPNNAAFSYTCNGNQVTFINTSALCPNQFTWDFGDPGSGALNVSTVQNTAHTYPGPGTYNVTFTAAGPCNAPSTVVVPITILDVSITAVDPQCIANSGSATAVVTGSAGPFSFLWSPGGQTSATITGLASGTYSVEVSSPSACAGTASVTLNAPSFPLALTLGSSDVACNGGTDGTAGVTVGGGVAPVDVLWSPGGQTTSTISGLTAGTYTITVSDGAGCVVDTAITVNGPPPLVVTAMPDAAICSGGSVTLTAASTGGTGATVLTWSPAGPGVSPATTTTYAVTATDANGCLSPSDNVTITVGSAILPVIGSSLPQGCAPWCVDLNTSTPGASFSWTFGDGASGTGPSVDHCYGTAGNFDVTLTVTDASGCTGATTAPGLVTAFAVPQASFVPSPSVAIISDPSFNLTNTSSGAQDFSWTFGDAAGSVSIEPSPSVTYPAIGCYPVELVAMSDAGCSDTARAALCVEDEFALYAPNAFTPNNDGINDAFGVVTSVRDPKEFELRVFDRWGGEVWSTTDRTATWSAGGVADGVYAWTLSLKDATGTLRKQRGHVVVLR